MNNIYNYKITELKEYLKNNNEKEFKATQIFEWLYKKRVKTFDEMTNIKKETLEKLKKDFEIKQLEIIKIQKDKDVSKYLFNLKDNNKIEAVLMNHD